MTPDIHMGSLTNIQINGGIPALQVGNCDENSLGKLELKKKKQKRRNNYH
jgi:hypothetical protein